MSPITSRISLAVLLKLDAVTCLATGLLLSGFSAPLAEIFRIPARFLFLSGLALFPIALAFLVAARFTRRFPGGGSLLALGNFAWVLASLAVLVVFEPTVVGYAFVLAQALVVALLGGLEWRAAAREALR
jgi:hypothetical protein